ncbi:MAG: rpsA 2 [Gammaproteobacteria bacterium]|jgi:uncharacterized protein|nr:rpsA 2 [Gammaproteobacteria bacterium]
MNVSQIIASELNVKPQQVTAAIALLDDGATVPFISRYRKEVTEGLTDTNLRHLEERLYYLRELGERRQTILETIAAQGKLTPELEKSILAADTKSSLEDLYLPYKPKRHTKAQIAREAGLAPLAEQLHQDPSLHPEVIAQQFLNPEKGVDSAEKALEGARHILMESFAEHAELLGHLREFLWQHGVMKSEVMKNKEVEGAKFKDYFEYREPIKKIPSHRALALMRGQKESILKISLILNEIDETKCLQKIQHTFNISDQGRPADPWLIETCAWMWRIKLFLKLEVELAVKLREEAEEEAIKVFASNLKNLLMMAPAGSRVTLGLDPGLRTGVKVVVIDGTGKLLAHTTVFPHPPKNNWAASVAEIAKLCAEFGVELASIGNGTASRETDKLISELKKQHPELKLTSLVVSESGASVYSASELAAQEFPDLDVSYRGAVSIGRRLQDPLAELVKIDPKAIGVGQYQHDLNQVKLMRMLRAVMEDCVNAVGVNLNTASVPLLSCVAGVSESIARNIVAFRDEHGAFKKRQQLKKVPRLGEKVFEQAAGFLRVIDGDEPLDASAVHPESYVVVERILAEQNKTFKEIMGNQDFLKSLDPARYIDEKFGLPTVTDILQELEKPGRDPRPEFKAATFKEGVEKIGDLKPDMVLEGVITNVANFGAFVDIGVHQDGLVHISALSHNYIKDPHMAVKVGQIVKVKVVEVDVSRKRIQLSMKLDTVPEQPVKKSAYKKSTPSKKPVAKQNPNPKLKAPVHKETAMGNALMVAMGKLKS